MQRLAPLLERFHQYRPGDVHAVAAKVHLEAGFKACGSNAFTGVLWSHDGTALTVSFTGGVRTSLILQDFNLVTKCSCETWQPARNCPHVVVAWATLKRLVSPEALAHIRFAPELVAGMKGGLGSATAFPPGIPAGEGDVKSAAQGAPSPVSLVPLDRGMESVPEGDRSRFCLVVAPDGEGGLSGCVMRGTERVTGWSPGIPTELSLFLLLDHPYASTPSYFEKFLQVTGGRHPIVFCDPQGTGTVLSYAGDAPRTLGVSFDFREGDVAVSRSTEKGPIPDAAFLHGKLLFDLEAGLVHPVADALGLDRLQQTD